MEHRELEAQVDEIYSRQDRLTFKVLHAMAAFVIENGGISQIAPVSGDNIGLDVVAPSSDNV